MPVPSLIKDSALHQLLLKGRSYTIDKKQILQSTEDRQVVNIITSGFIRKYWVANDGSIGALIVYGPGDIFPLTLVYKKMFNQSLYSGLETYFYEAMSRTEVHSMTVDQLLEADKENSRLYEDLLQEAGRHLEFCIHSLENLSLRSSEKRVAHLLVYFARKYAIQRDGETVINAPLSHQSIGEMLSITRETVTNSMKGLRDKGLIKTGKHFVVPNLKKLEKEAYS